MSADRLFIKVHNGFPEHRKTAGLSDKGFRHLVEAWCFCSRNLNDGLITKAQSSKLFTPRTLSELIAAGWVATTTTGYEMLDYLDHQMSAAQVADLREKRAAAGRLGGKAKASHAASASAVDKQTPSKSVADIDVDTDVDKNKDQEPSRAPRGRRLPDDWQPSRELIEEARIAFPTVDLRDETESFRDWWARERGDGDQPAGDPADRGRDPSTDAHRASDQRAHGSTEQPEGEQR